MAVYSSSVERNHSRNKLLKTLSLLYVIHRQLYGRIQYKIRGGYRRNAKGAVERPPPPQPSFLNTKMNPRTYHDIDYKNTPKLPFLLPFELDLGRLWEWS